MPAWKMTVEYDGSRYSGWQEQKNAPKTVMGALREAIENTLGAQAELHGAGRTDAGVHALGQVLHVKAAPKRALSGTAILSAVNDALGHDITVLSVEEVPDNFHARHHAESRCYLYRLSLRKNAFAKRHVWWVKESLNLDDMREAAAMLPGRHDFTAFHASDPSRPNESPIVVVEAAHLTQDRDELHFRIEASHFLWRMVRRIAGALVRVGTGEFAVADFAAALDGDVRHQNAIARWTAPAAGLYLEAVRYRSASWEGTTPQRGNVSTGRVSGGRAPDAGIAATRRGNPARRGGSKSGRGVSPPSRSSDRGRPAEKR